MKACCRTCREAAPTRGRRAVRTPTPPPGWWWRRWSGATDASNTPRTGGTTTTTPPKPAREGGREEGGRVSVTRSVCFAAAAGGGGPAHLSPQRDALSQLLDGQLVVEVALLGRAAEPADDGGGGEDDDDEEAQAVDEDLQVGLGGQRRGRQLCSEQVNTKPNKPTVRRPARRQAEETEAR